MRTQEIIQEIERIAARDYTGGKDVLNPGPGQKAFKKLPGGSGLLYSIEGNNDAPVIKLWDPSVQVPSTGREPKKQPFELWYEYYERLEAWQEKQRTLAAGGQYRGKTQPQIIGKLSLENLRSFPIPGALEVETITVDEDYRGRGLAKALYGIVLTIMRRPLVAGSSQTPGGRQNWVSLASIPGVEIKGYIYFDENALATIPNPEDNFQRATNRLRSARIDTIMGKLGGQYLGQSRSGDLYFAFDVAPNASGKELEAYVKQNLARVYDEGYTIASGLYAVWTGQ